MSLHAARIAPSARRDSWVAKMTCRRLPQPGTHASRSRRPKRWLPRTFVRPLFTLCLLGLVRGTGAVVPNGSPADVGGDDRFIQKVRHDFTPATSASIVATVRAVVDSVQGPPAGPGMNLIKLQPVGPVWRLDFATSSATTKTDSVCPLGRIFRHLAPT